MKYAPTRRAEPIPTTIGVFFWTFLTTVVGLTVLLIIPIYTQRQYDKYQVIVEDQTEPARHQAARALDNAYQARAFAVSCYFLLEEAPHPGYKSQLAYYNAKLREWDQIARDEVRIGECGKAALDYWRTGTQSIARWLKVYGRQYVESGGALEQEDLLKSEALFASGIRELRDVQDEIGRRQQNVRAEAHALRHSQLLVTIPLIGVCILIASLTWWNAARLMYWSTREQETAQRLQVAVREIHHRVKNNLQVINALLQLSASRRTHGDVSFPLRHVSRQVRTLAFVHGLFDYERGVDSINAHLLLQQLSAMSLVPPGMKLKLDGESMPLNPKEATSIALIVGELLLMCCERDATEVFITLGADASSRHMLLSDNSRCVGENVDDQSTTRTNLELVQTLVRHDLLGDLTVNRKNCALVEITFPAQR